MLPLALLHAFFHDVIINEVPWRNFLETVPNPLESAFLIEGNGAMVVSVDLQPEGLHISIDSQAFEKLHHAYCISAPMVCME